MTYCICDKNGTCLEHLNKQYNANQQERAWQEMKRLAKWDNKNFSTKEIWFEKTNKDMRNQHLSYGGSILFRTYRGVLTGVPEAYYLG